jgi:hypothetical protein
MLVVFSNHSYSNHPARQADEIEELRRGFEAEGVELLGLGTYPSSRPIDAYPG